MSKKEREGNRAARAAAIQKQQAAQERNRKILIVVVVLVVLAAVVAAGVLFSGGDKHAGELGPVAQGGGQRAGPEGRRRPGREGEGGRLRGLPVPLLP